MSSASVLIFARSSGVAVIMDRYGTRLLAALGAVSARQTTDTLRHLDARVEIVGRAHWGVTGGWARAQALIPGEHGAP